jgi:hypothetical protein
VVVKWVGCKDGGGREREHRTQPSDVWVEDLCDGECFQAFYPCPTILTGGAANLGGISVPKPLRILPCLVGASRGSGKWVLEFGVNS